MPSPLARTGRPRLLLIVAAIGVIAAIVLLAGERLPELAERVGEVGERAPLLFVLIFAVATTLFVPASLLLILAGAIYGLVLGTVYAFAGAVLGACAGFLVARHLLRGAVERSLASHARMRAVTTAVASMGKRAVALLRLSPVIPFNAINLGMGVTRIAFMDYLIGTLAMLPVTIMYVYYGTVAGTIVAAARGETHKGPGYYAMLGVGLLATVIVTTLITRAARRALAEHEAEHSASLSAAGGAGRS